MHQPNRKRHNPPRSRFHLLLFFMDVVWLTVSQTSTNVAVKNGANWAEERKVFHVITQTRGLIGEPTRVELDLDGRGFESSHRLAY